VADTVRLGIDWGKARIGVAAANAGTSFAYPVETVQAGPDELRRLTAIIAEYEPGAEYVVERAAGLASAVAPVAVRLVDERMSTVSASRSLGSAGRRAKQQRRVIDQAAAVEILQRALDVEERSGALAGEPASREEL
jgi:putative Holliday junction resolvase